MGLLMDEWKEADDGDGLPAPPPPPQPTPPDAVAGSTSSCEWSRDGRLKMDRLSEERRDDRPPRSTSGVELTGCSSVFPKCDFKQIYLHKLELIESNERSVICENLLQYKET